MWFPVLSACLRGRAVSKSGFVVASLCPKHREANVSHFSHSAGRCSQTCQALIYRKHGDPSRVVEANFAI
ncbi:hypothetical protein ILYODFUR_037987 [Ilyodon furcidens]|uniref:Secreted protein n=1 Tax=Ilyodon furcidens TaxID=33524 RepID=A0ABV0U2Z5_9TELE